MKTLLLLSCLLLSRAVFSQVIKVQNSGEILLNGEKVKVELEYTKNGYSTQDYIKVGMIIANNDSISTEGTSHWSNQANEEVYLYTNKSFDDFLRNIDMALDTLELHNQDEIDCTGNKLNAFLMVYDKDENFYGNCLELK